MRRSDPPAPYLIGKLSGTNAPNGPHPVIFSRLLDISVVDAIFRRSRHRLTPIKGTTLRNSLPLYYHRFLTQRKEVARREVPTRILRLPSYDLWRDFILMGNYTITAALFTARVHRMNIDTANRIDLYGIRHTLDYRHIDIYVDNLELFIYFYIINDSFLISKIILLISFNRKSLIKARFYIKPTLLRFQSFTHRLTTTCQKVVQIITDNNGRSTLLRGTLKVVSIFRVRCKSRLGLGNLTIDTLQRYLN